MLQYIKNWYNSKFISNEPAVFLAVVIVGLLIVIFFGALIAPLLAAVVIAYLLESLVSLLTKYLKIPRIISVYVVFIAFMAFLIGLILFLLPTISNQASQFIKNTPLLIDRLRLSLFQFADQYPHIITHAQIQDVVNAISSTQFDHLANIGQYILQVSLASLPTVFMAFIYLFLVPLLVFYCLKDKEVLISWFVRMLPSKRGSLIYVWEDLRPQLGNYVKGKTIEILIVGVVSYIAFLYFGLNYALLLALGVGLSVIIPYVGAIAITVPIAFVGLAQFGMTSTFAWLMVVYLVIQMLDGNVLVPIIFSETVQLHPIAVIAAVLIFGGIWGFLGLFFAIPLASLVKSGLKMWVSESQKRQQIELG